jgi:hypothetical protein
MSSNLAVINFAVGGSLTVSGKTTLAETVLSSSSVDIQGLTTTSLNSTGKTTLKDTLISTSTGSFQGLSTTTLDATSTGSFQGLSTTNLNATGLSTFNSSLPTSTLKPTLDNDFTTKIYVDTADSTNKTYIDTNVSPINKFLFSGLKNSTEDPTITPTNISVGYNTTSGLTTGRNNTVIGQNCMSLTTSSSNNTVFGSSIMQSFNPSGADGSNIAFGRMVLQILKTGTFNVGYGLNVLGSLTNGSFNTALGINAGSSVIGSNNTCIGTNTGQSGTTLFQKSTALGFGSLINASNQIMLGTIDDTVYAPNALFLAGINILTRISDSISTAFTNFLAGSNNVIQMKVYNSPNKTQGGLASTNAKGTTYTILFSDIFVSKSNSSTIQVIFDCQWGISGPGFTNDSWKSSIFINGQIIATKIVVFNNDSRNSSVVLFPISAAIINDTKNKNIPISIQAAAIQANPDQTLTLNTYNVTFIEIQN